MPYRTSKEVEPTQDSKPRRNEKDDGEDLEKIGQRVGKAQGCASGYSRLPHNPYPSVDCPGYGVSGSMDFKERPNKGQTNKIFFKNPEKESEDRYYAVAIETA